MSAVELSRNDARTGVDALYRTYRQDVYRSLLRDLGSPSDADDATQTVFLSAMRALDRGCRPRAARAWLLAIARNVARRTWRERSGTAPLDPDEIAARDAPDETRRELFAVLQDLPTGQRTALLLHELYGLEYAEISAVTDQSVGGIEAAVSRGRKAVRTALLREGAVDHDDASRLLRRLVDGKLTRLERQAVAAHIARCETCASAEHELRGTRHRRGLLAWLTSVPSLQRVVAALQASPLRGAGAVAVCALGLAGISGGGQGGHAAARDDAAARHAGSARPAATMTAVSRPTAHPAAAVGSQPTRAPHRTAAHRAVVSPPARVSVAPHASATGGAPPTSAPSDTGSPSSRPGPRHEAPAKVADAAASPPTPDAKPTSEPLLTVPVDLDGPLDDVGSIVAGVGAGDLSSAGAAAYDVVAGVVEDLGLPAPPRVAEPVGETADTVTGTVVSTVPVPPVGP